MINKYKNNTPVKLSSKHLLGIENLNSDEMLNLIERSDHFANLITKDSNQINTNNFSSILSGKTIINLFFESSTRTRVSFEVACKKLGGSVLNISVSGSSVKKGETLIDTATTLNAMNPDILVIRHHAAGAPLLLSKFIDASVINAGDGRHEHPTQALLDALTIKRRFGKIAGLNISICGDIANSRVARSNMYLLGSLGANLCLVSPSTLLPSKIENFGFPIFNDLEEYSNLNYRYKMQFNSKNDSSWEVAENLENIFKNCDAVLILTEWNEYSKIDWEKVSKEMRKPGWVFDARSIVDEKEVIKSNLNFWRIGDGSDKKQL